MEQRQADILKFPKKLRKPRKKQSKYKKRVKKFMSIFDMPEITTVVIGVVGAEMTYDLIKFLAHFIFP